MATVANSEDPDEMPQNVAFHLCLHFFARNMIQLGNYYL